MRIDVDMSVCESNAQCVLSAPDLFELDDDDELHWTEEPDEGWADAARKAAQACPVQAIRVQDSRQ